MGGIWDCVLLRPRTSRKRTVWILTDRRERERERSKKREKREKREREERESTRQHKTHHNTT